MLSGAHTIIPVPQSSPVFRLTDPSLSMHFNTLARKTGFVSLPQARLVAVGHAPLNLRVTELSAVARRRGRFARRARQALKRHGLIGPIRQATRQLHLDFVKLLTRRWQLHLLHL
jgi:hypothetical protein